MTLADDVERALDEVTAVLPAGEARPGQRQMASAVAHAISAKRALIVQAGTGTGKSLAYLVPAVMSGKTTVIATATKALQDQLAGKDLPFLQQHLDHDFTFAVVKGRSNYLCLQRMHEATTSDLQLGLQLGEPSTSAKSAPATTTTGANASDDDGPPLPNELVELVAWAATTPTGDRADLEHEPSNRAWNTVSVGPRECPGASQCPRGQQCFAERARHAAADADIIVVNTHLYGMHLASGGGLLPEHDIVVIDEAHQLEDTISATAGTEIGPGRLFALERNTRAILADESVCAAVVKAGESLADALGEHRARRLKGALDPILCDALMDARINAAEVISALRKIPDDAPNDAAARKHRAMKAATSLVDDLDVALEMPSGCVAWVEGFADSPLMKIAPIDVAPVLEETLFEHDTVVLTSATIPKGMAARVGLDDDHDDLDVGSPFDYPNNALLYCATHMPDPRTSGYDEALQRELELLIVAAGGRTLALFTSYRAMDEAAAVLRPRLPWTLLTQKDLPKPALVERFQSDETSCLFATMSFWQGIDVPGRALSLVTIDRLPFPRPDDPLLQARRDQARADAFRTVDLPRAATLLAQGAGRLIRRSDDRGVVAVLDPRLAKNQSYRWDIVNALPPMKRTRERSEAEAFLRAIRDEADG
jgi:ATP-dependent DNA helicase DinG